jgi:hypothetical protein
MVRLVIHATVTFPAVPLPSDTVGGYARANARRIMVTILAMMLSELTPIITRA